MNLTALKMKTSFFFLVLATSGCSWLPSAPHSAQPAAAAPAPIITPDYSLAATVVKVNTVGRFIILGFPASQTPKLDQSLFLYRGGLKVAEVRVTGPGQESYTVADLVSGEAQVGDTVREQ